MTTEEYYDAVLTALDEIKTIDEASRSYLDTIRATFVTYQDDLDTLISNSNTLVANSNTLVANSNRNTTRLTSIANDLEAIQESVNTLLSRILFGYYHASGRLTGSGGVRQTPGYLGGVIANTNGVADAVLTVYDNITPSGKILYRVTVAGLDNQGGIFFGSLPIRFEIGCARTITGAGATGYIYYR